MEAHAFSNEITNHIASCVSSRLTYVIYTGSGHSTYVYCVVIM